LRLADPFRSFVAHPPDFFSSLLVIAAAIVTGVLSFAYLQAIAAHSIALTFVLAMLMWEVACQGLRHPLIFAK
jgi:hypothetical protein